jgi:uncharacterized protein YceH (UPF0502 family)
MSAGRSDAEIMAERMAVVLEIGAANGARQRAQARLGGAQIDLMRLEDAGPEYLAAAQARDAAARAALAEAAARIEALDGRLAALDRELAAVVRG